MTEIMNSLKPLVLLAMVGTLGLNPVSAQAQVSAESRADSFQGTIIYRSYVLYHPSTIHGNSEFSFQGGQQRVTIRDPYSYIFDPTHSAMVRAADAKSRFDAVKSGGPLDELEAMKRVRVGDVVTVPQPWNKEVLLYVDPISDSVVTGIRYGRPSLALNEWREYGLEEVGNQTVRKLSTEAEPLAITCQLLDDERLKDCELTSGTRYQARMEFDYEVEGFLYRVATQIELEGELVSEQIYEILSLEPGLPDDFEQQLRQWLPEGFAVVDGAVFPPVTVPYEFIADRADPSNLSIDEMREIVQEFRLSGRRSFSSMAGGMIAALAGGISAAVFMRRKSRV